MSRSIKKGPAVDLKLIKKVEKAKAEGNKKPIKTWARACTIIPDFVGCTFSIHCGNKFVDVAITEMMVSHKLGEFAPTRTFRGHKKK